ncbi:MAG: hypothetical protein KDB27_32325 [Planctomycetales bacterium]|nr:hypothetical protein [Planctomycetales bacterium]
MRSLSAYTEISGNLEMLAHENPYSTPPAYSEEVRPLTYDRVALVGEVVVMWEKLRFVYIAIVGTYSLIVFSVTLYLGLTTLIMFLRIALVGGIFSNFCFCAGPLIDGYLTWFGFRSRGVTIFLFVSGLLLTMLLATATIFPLGSLLPAQM